MGESNSRGIGEVDSSRSSWGGGAVSATRPSETTQSTGDSNLGDGGRRQPPSQAVFVTASGKRAKSRIQNSAKVRLNRVIAQMSAALRFREALAKILADMFETAKDAVDENSTVQERRELNEKFAQLGRSARLFSEQANPIPYIDRDIESLFSAETKLVTDQLKDVSGSPGISGDGKLVTFIHESSNVVQKNVDTGAEQVLGRAPKARCQPYTSMNGEVIAYFSANTIKRRFRSEAESADLAEAPPDEEITAAALSQDGSSVVYVTTQHDSREKLVGYDVRSVKTRSMTTNKVDYVEKGEIVDLRVSSDGGYLAYLTKLAEDTYEVIACDIEAQYSERFDAYKSTTREGLRIAGVTDQGLAYFVAPSKLNPNHSSLYRFEIKTIATKELFELPGEISLSSVTLGNDGLSLFFLSNQMGSGLVLYRADLVDRNLKQLGSELEPLDSHPEEIMTISPDGQTIFHTKDTKSLLRTVMRRTPVQMTTEATLHYAPVKRAVCGVEAALSGIGGYVLSSRVTADDSLKRIQENQTLLRDSVRQLNEGLGELQELYAHLSYRPKGIDGEELQINDIDAAIVLSQDLLQRMREAPIVARAAQSKIEPEIAFALLNDSD